MERDVYSGRLKLLGEENETTLLAANNYAASLLILERFAEAKSLMRRWIPVARRVLGAEHRLMLRIRWTSARALILDPSAMLDDLREAMTMLKDTDRIARRVLGGSHPVAVYIVQQLQNSRAALAAREGTQPGDERP